MCKYFLSRWKLCTERDKIVDAHMEFLNPEDKRARTIKLFIGYALIAVLIGLATMILVYLAQGYGYNPGKGVSQNGLLFVDSKPVSADVYIDNQQKAKTDARLTLSEGTHLVGLKRDKYRDWSKTVNVSGGTVVYLLYPRLFPIDIALGITQAYATPPAWVSQSPDRHWLIMQPKIDSLSIVVNDLLKPTNEPKTLVLPSSQVPAENGTYGTIVPIEWSDDNRHLLIQQTLPSGKVSYIVIDREDISQTVNISAKLNFSGTAKVVLRDKKYDKYYVHDASNGNLQVADLKSGLQAGAIATGVVAYKAYANDIILYVTYVNAKPGEANVMILNNQTDLYMLQSLQRDSDSRYLLDVAKFDNSWYYITAAVSGKKAILYRDPLSKVKPGNTKPINPRLALLINNPQFASFSDNARFISLQSGKQFVVFDAELNRVYRYESTLSLATTQQAKWMDGHRMTAVTDGKVQVFDFDGLNLQALTASRPEYSAYFDRDYQYLYTLVPQADGSVGLQNGKLVVD